MSEATVEIDVLAVAEKVLAGPRGVHAVSVIEIRALALFVLQQNEKPQIEKENENGNDANQ